MARFSLVLICLLACDTDPSTKDAILDTGSTETGESALPPTDADEDGFSADEDCDDTNADVHPGADEICDGIDNDCDTLVDDADDSLDTTTQSAWYRDADGDTYGNESDKVEACDAPTWYVEENAAGFDCDDTNPAYHPGATEADCTDPNDYNCDGSVAYADADNDGWPACLDCNDANGAIHPDAVEICDTLDNDCDGEIDDADASLDSSTATHWYADTDSDSFGNAENSVLLCEMPTGYLADNTDCDDNLNTTFPGADEYCDGVDSDCDGTLDEDDALDVATWYADSDSDGYGDNASTDIDCYQPSGYVADNTDCDDTDNTAFPSADEVCDGVDNDCLGDVDEDDATDVLTWYADTDTDGYGDNASTDIDCYQPSGYVADNTDCDDADEDVNPGETERCNWADDNCDGVADEGLPDVDGSGFADCKEVAIVLTVGNQAGGNSGSCEGLTYMDREIQEVDAFLSDLNLSSVLFYDDVSTGVTWSEISPYPVVIYHNGGWSSAGSLAVQDALESAATAGTGLLFLGDDLGKHARNMANAHGSNAFYDLAYISNYTGRVYNTTVSANTTNHDVIDGDYGLVGSYSYVADLDTVSAASLGETVLMSTPDNTPAVLAAEDSAGQRTVSVIGSIYNSHDCPISDSAGLGDLEVLFKNSIHWLEDW